MDYDKKYATCFTESLFAYLENAWNVVESAKALNIHRNSMGYRLEKIQEILKISLKDKNTGFHIHLSLKILEYTGDIAIKAAETVRNKESR